MSDDNRLPAWAQELRTRYISGEASLFLLSGNVRDLYPWTDDKGDVHFIDLQTFLIRFLTRAKDEALYYNISDGLSVKGGKRYEILSRINTRRQVQGKSPFPKLPSEVSEVLQAVECLITDRDANAAVVLDYVETIAPMGTMSFMSEEEKANLVRLQRWTSNPMLLSTDNLVVMITENLSDVHRRLVSCAQLATVNIPLPDADARLEFVQESDRSGVDFTKDMSIEAFSNVSAGLTLVQVRALLRRAQQSGDAIDFRTVSLRKKSIIEQECHGLVEFVAPEHDFSHVGGMSELKDELMRVAAAIKAGRRNQVPMGMLFVGPMGTGKTFIAEAFAGESGLTCLKFKNFREKWVGSTEGNLEKILQVVHGLGYVLLIIDEADRSMNSGTDGDGGTSSRVIARIKEFMSDTSHRGRVVVLMMTNRPDKIDIDLKRPGRLDYKIPFFFPQDEETRQAILEALVRKNKVQLEKGADVMAISPKTEGYSAAELESVLLRAMRLASEDDRAKVSDSDLMQAATDVIPSRDTRMLEYMEMLAVFESSSKQMLPPKFREIPTKEVHKRLDVLRNQLGIVLRA